VRSSNQKDAVSRGCPDLRRCIWIEINFEQFRLH